MPVLCAQFLYELLHHRTHTALKASSTGLCPIATDDFYQLQAIETAAKCVPQRAMIIGQGCKLGLNSDSQCQLVQLQSCRCVPCLHSLMAKDVSAKPLEGLSGQGRRLRPG